MGIAGNSSRSCGLRESSPAELALGVQASDSAVELGSLFGVDPPRRYPFRQTVGVDAAGPAFLQEMGVVISAEQGQLSRSVGPPSIQSMMWCRSHHCGG